MPVGINSLMLARELLDRHLKTNDPWVAPQDLSDLVQKCVDPKGGIDSAVTEGDKKKRGRPKSNGVPKAKQTWKTHKARPLNPDEDFCDCVVDFGPDRVCPKCKGTGIVKKTIEVQAISIEKLSPQPPAPAAAAAAPPAGSRPGPAAPSIAASAAAPAPLPSSAESSAAASPAPVPAAAAPAADQARDDHVASDENKEPSRWGYKIGKEGFTILFNGEPKGSSSVIGYKPRSDDECRFRADHVLEKILELDARVPYDPSKWVHVWSWQSQNEKKGAL